MPSRLRGRLRDLLGWLFLASLALTLWLGHGPSGPRGAIAAQPHTPDQLIQEGVSLYAAGDYLSAIDRWQAALGGYDPSAQPRRALVHENLARAYGQVGQSAEALAAWTAAAAIYATLGDRTQVGRLLSEQAQVHLSLGQHRRAIALLCLPPPEASPTDLDACEPGGALPLALAAGDALGQVAALGSLGEAYRLRGDYAEAETLLTRGLELARQSGYAQFEGPLLNGLGSLFNRRSRVDYRRAEAARQLGLTGTAEGFSAQAEGYERQAQQRFEQALALAQQWGDLAAEWQTRLNLLPIYRQQNNGAAVMAARQRLSDLSGQLPASRGLAYGAIALGRSYQLGDRSVGCVAPGSEAAAEAWLERGAAIGDRIGDVRAASFALGELGHLRECQGDLAAAMRLTQQAQGLATQGLGAADSLYLWQWQAGRIYRLQGKVEAALAAYNQAVTTLESIRTEILVADPDVQFDFRDTVEPIYRELIELQLAGVQPLQAAAKQNQAAAAPSPLAAALVTADALRLAELQNYFGNDCILSPVAQARVDLLAQSTDTAVISSVVLSDRTALILTLPSQPPQLVWVEDSARLRDTVVQFRLGLEAFYTEPYDTALAEQLYAQLVAPLEPALRAAQITTLVFIHDGFLRSVPMAALHDGRQFLIENYAIATTPALTLTAPESRRAESPQALVLGSSQAVVAAGRRFPPIPAVPQEVAAVLNELPGSRALLDEAFGEAQLQQALQAAPYAILHFATHGQFSLDPADNFIITGQGETVTFGQLEAFIQAGGPGRQQVDLVMLTACDTAAGDDRATLGLAGVAIRAGARSAIASLWQADDATTAQITQDFYRFLKDPALNKAQALQQAQILALRRGGSVTPGKWAPLILVGNWL
ncbi:CHAT domain-containing protein [Nodosilinea sp. PGN35]|uniref:CHAT domain-containing protein n=1 Tax=Nodosilinea sp. PGN35 TaxID=3020489 RepID=UPI0023B3553F|nr:CHAT domain-containing protein [Nodosilinea sp. TSF1-S3]MDF0366768.1 CHAT domain-containing protein [Nodosilinea sp. TSF1-S3]